jgi:hypothetical protein
MDRKLGIIGSALTGVATAGFAVAMLVDIIALCYLFSIFIAWGLVMMNGAFVRYRRGDATVAAVCAVAFGGMYALCNTVVYFVQLSTVRNAALGAEALALLDYEQFGMMFDLDLLGYCLMAISTFFAGLTIDVQDRADAWLRTLLMVHGVFAFGCFIMPMLGVFSASSAGGDLTGTIMLEFWCVYFIPVCILAMRHFARRERMPLDA